MNWEAAGAVSELFGAVAVVVTLFFLLAQIRQNTIILEKNSDLVRDGAANQNYQDLARWRDLIIRDPGLTALWHSGIAGDDLSEIDAERFIQILNEFTFGLWRGYESAVVAGNESLRNELVRVAASFTGSSVVENQFRHLAQSPAFSVFATEVVNQIGQVDHVSEAKELYDSFRQH